MCFLACCNDGPERDGRHCVSLTRSKDIVVRNVRSQKNWLFFHQARFNEIVAGMGF